MTHPEQHAAHCESAPRLLRALLALAASLLVTAFFTAGARAEDFSIGEWGTAAGQVNTPAGIAVSRHSGDLYVVDSTYGARIAQFTSTGAWVRAFGWSVAPGAATGTANLSQGSNILTSTETATGAFLEEDTVSGPGLPPEDQIELNGLLGAGLRLSKPATESRTGSPITTTAAPGHVPTNELQQLTVDATAGTFALAFTSPIPGATTATTSPIPFDATAAEVEGALQGLSNVGAGNVSVTGAAGGPYAVEFKGPRYADTNVAQLQPESSGLTGGEHQATVTTARQGAAALESCTTVCIHGEEGSGAGQFTHASSIAIDNSGGPSEGDVYVTDNSNYRVEKFGPNGEFLLMFGGEVDKTTHADLCTEADLEAGDSCGAGVKGSGNGQFSWSGLAAPIAVGPGGVVYVGDAGGALQEFDESGHFEKKLTFPEPIAVRALAVDSNGIYVHQDEEHHEVAGVQRYSLTGALQETLDASGAPRVLALDASGDLFVGPGRQLASGYEFKGYNTAGRLFALFTSAQLRENESTEVRGIAVGDAAGKLYATNPYEVQLSDGAHNAAHIAAIDVPATGPPLVSEIGAEDVEPTTATLSATVNPAGFETSYHFEYIARQRYEEDGDHFGAGTETTPTGHLELVYRKDHVQAAISPLVPGTAYRVRLIAENEKGTEETGGEFSSLPAVSIRNFTTQTVAPEEVLLKAELSPNNGTSTEYEICYGKEAGVYNLGCRSHPLEGAAGNEFKQVTAAFEHLDPNTEYHYRLTATNSYGVQVSSPDQAFTTEETISEQDAREACPNSLRREENSSLALPDCRAYEQVSPAEKSGYPTTLAWLAPSGERAAFNSVGTFAGQAGNLLENFYVANRTAGGWSTQGTVRTPEPGFVYENNFSQFDAELDRWIYLVAPGSNAREGYTYSPGVDAFVGDALDGSSFPATPLLDPAALHEGAIAAGGKTAEIVASSSDLSHLFLLTNQRLLESDPQPDPPNGGMPSRLYEADNAVSPPALRLVTELPPGLMGQGFCRLEMPQVGNNAASADGAAVFYSAPLEVLPHAPCKESEDPRQAINPEAVFASTGEAPPVRVSAVPPAQCHSPSPCSEGSLSRADLIAISPDATRAWFTTRQPLVDSDADPATDTSEAANDLYLAKLQGGQVTELVQASHGEASDPTPGRGAGVRGVLGVSSDGSHAAFVATGVLTTEPNSNGEEASQGADNLYLYDAESGRIRFVARLCSGPEESGSLSGDHACPKGLDKSVSATSRNDADLWSGGYQHQSQLTPDGRYLLFSSYGRLAPSDTDTARDVYRYDFATGELIRVSIGHRGNDANGNDDAYDAEIAGSGHSTAFEAAGDGNRAISDNGSVVVFQTVAPLVSRDTNGPGRQPGCIANTTGCDAYEWRQDGTGTCREAGGCISLLSDGTTTQGSLRPIVSASGRDVIFATAGALVPSDTDGVGDIYDAREGGGFPYVPPAKLPCQEGSAEACHGESTHESLPINPITESLQTGGNGAPEISCAKGKHKVKKHGQVRCVTNQRRSHKKHRHHKHKRAARTGGHR